MKRFTKTNADFKIDFSNPKTLQDVYGRYSYRQQREYKYCRQLERELNGYDPFGSILTATPQTFTYAFISWVKALDVISSETGDIVFHYQDDNTIDERTGLLNHSIIAKFKITACYDYCLLEDIGERGCGLIKIPAHCYARVIAENDVEYIVE